MGQIIQGDALAVLRTIRDSSVDSIVTDPPAGISFMGKDWDGAKGGRDQWVSWLAEIMAEARRVLKPGGHALVWSIPRTSHWTALALENAGFEIRDCINHIYGEGMPKSHNISKAIDRRAGAERAITRISENTRPTHRKGGRGFDKALGPAEAATIYETAPATPEGAEWDGWGTALKPAVEIWWLARAPLTEDTIAANVLKWETGAINIDACRIGTEARVNNPAGNKPGGNSFNMSVVGMPKDAAPVMASGRWPANLLLSHTLYCQPDNCAQGCPVAELDSQGGTSKETARRYSRSGGIWKSGGDGGIATAYGDQGGVSRYFAQFYYCPKAGKRERNAGCQDLPALAVAHRGHENQETDDVTARFISQPQGNHHPTVKPLALCKYLIRLITPPGGCVLDMFGGSGTTALACVAEGFNYLLIEQNSEYIEIARARVAYAEKEIEAA